MEVLTTDVGIFINRQVLSSDTMNPLLQETLISLQKSIKGQIMVSTGIAGAKRNTAKVPHSSALSVANTMPINAQSPRPNFYLILSA